MPSDSVLICNTYHELTDRQLILGHASHALRSGGRLVITDREPAQGSSNHHEVALAEAVADLERTGFRLIQKDPALLTDPGGEVWWLLIATKP